MRENQISRFARTDERVEVLLLQELGVETCPDFGKVVVVVFGDEVEMVDETHGLFEAGMQKSLRELRGLKRFEFSHQGGTRHPKFVEEFRYVPRIVIGFVGLPILQIGRGEILFAFDKIVHAGCPQRFEIE